MNLKYDEALSNFAVNFNSRRYSTEGCAWDGRESERAAHQAACPLSRLIARFEDERRVFADVLVTVAGGYQRGTNYALLHASRHDSLAHVVERLLAEGADVNSAAPVNGATALHLAAQEGNLRVVERLIAGDADVDKKSTAGTTALRLAASEGHVDVVERLIVAGADVHLPGTEDGITPLYAAAQEGHLPVLERLLTAGAAVDTPRTDSGCGTPLDIAAYRGHVSVAERLLAAGAVVDSANIDGATPLYIVGRCRLTSIKTHVESAYGFSA